MVIELAVDLSAHCGKNEIDPAAWRIVARKWMENHRLIVITKPANVLPHFPKKRATINDVAQ